MDVHQIEEALIEPFAQHYLKDTNIPHSEFSKEIIDSVLAHELFHAHSEGHHGFGEKGGPENLASEHSADTAMALDKCRELYRDGREELIDPILKTFITARSRNLGDYVHYNSNRDRSSEVAAPTAYNTSMTLAVLLSAHENGSLKDILLNAQHTDILDITSALTDKAVEMELNDPDIQIQMAESHAFFNEKLSDFLEVANDSLEKHSSSDFEPITNADVVENLPGIAYKIEGPQLADASLSK